MNTALNSTRPGDWAPGLVFVGYVAIILGALDPFEGSIIVLFGAALLFIGSWLSEDDHRIITYRAAVLALIATGIAALWTLSFFGGFGGNSGRSLWWALLILPYVFGWAMAIWDRRSPRWVARCGAAIGVWYLALGAIANNETVATATTVMALFGLIIIVGCVARLRNPAPR